MKTVTLAEMLSAKEARKERQDQVRTAHACPIVSITINMPGPRKALPVLSELRDYAVSRLKEKLQVVYQSATDSFTGPEALLAVHGEGAEIKKAAELIEEEQAFGRLLDLDVFSAAGELISRQSQGRKRSCLVCSRPAVECMRERSHQETELTAAVHRLLNQFRAFRTRHISPAAERIGALAVEAMLYEVTSTPAPGLVDRVNSGAHQDMDFYTFMASSAALSTTIARCAQAGLNHQQPLNELLPVLRWIGLEGEAAMFAATKGVNTQKGLLFSLGIAAAAAGYVGKNSSLVTEEALFAAVTQIAAGLVSKELKQTAAGRTLTAGERLYQQYGVTGIRGELESGLPTVQFQALPALRAALADGLTMNDALIDTLLVISLNIDDTTVMNRHNPSKMKEWAQPRIQHALALGGMRTPDGRSAIAALDEEFIKANISPGGAADLLAVTWFVYRMTQQQADFKGC